MPSTFLVFAGEDYYPSRAMGNLCGVCGSFREAVALVNSWCTPNSYRPGWYCHKHDWVVIVLIEDNKPLVQWEVDCEPDNPPYVFTPDYVKVN